LTDKTGGIKVPKISWFDWRKWQHKKAAFWVGFIPAIAVFLVRMLALLYVNPSLAFEEATIGALAIFIANASSYLIISKVSSKLPYSKEDREWFGTALGTGVAVTLIFWFLAKFLYWVGLHWTDLLGFDGGFFFIIIWVCLALSLGTAIGKNQVNSASLAYGLGTESVVILLIGLFESPLHALYLKTVFITIAATSWGVLRRTT
jgi:hypothetical protein